MKRMIFFLFLDFEGDYRGFVGFFENFRNRYGKFQKEIATDETRAFLRFSIFLLL